ncbi:HAD family hydrolase [Pseudoroseomonas globiformis]|uniref:phosphoglycolate phosphatase n=1 Tax=Teichococcus globiformis TaxID=2307229 RepID=A0ABV7FWW5_9PROT
MNRHCPEVILWDWDNTLVDAWMGVQAGMNAALRHFDKPEWTLQEVRDRARLSLRDSFPTIFGSQWEEARDVFYAAVRDRHLDGLMPLPGVMEALEACRHVPLCIVSNKQGAILRAEVAHLGWQSRFAAVVGAGDAEADKPSAAPILLALEAVSHQAGKRIWFVGDTGVDIRAANSAGCTSVLVGGAEHDGGVAALQPDLAFNDAHELANFLLGLAKSPPIA